MNQKVRTGLGVITILIITATAGYFVWSFFENEKPNVVLKPADDGDKLIYGRLEGWGPCPEGLTCSQDTFLYESGKLVFQGDLNQETQIENETIERLKDKIRKSGVMEKDCSGPGVFDYGVEYEMNIDDRTKKIGIDGTACWDDMDEVDKIINSYRKNYQRQGGA